MSVRAADVWAERVRDFCCARACGNVRRHNRRRTHLDEGSVGLVGALYAVATGKVTFMEQ